MSGGKVDASGGATAADGAKVANNPIGDLKLLIQQVASGEQMEVMDASIAHAEQHGRGDLAKGLADIKDSLEILLQKTTA